LDEREAQTLRLEVVSKILTLRCPKPTCGAAFLDFTGCLALTCHHCHVNFCAWCLREPGAGEEIHHHVGGPTLFFLFIIIVEK
jgi:hypothetical protein